MTDLHAAKYFHFWLSVWSSELWPDAVRVTPSGADMVAIVILAAAAESHCSHSDELRLKRSGQNFHFLFLNVSHVVPETLLVGGQFIIWTRK